MQRESKQAARRAGIRRSQARGVATRAKLLEAARELFMRHGYAAVSRSDIARHAGYGMGSIYHHFPEKRDMLFELIDEWAKAMRQRAVFDLQGTLGGQPRRAIRSFLQKRMAQLDRGPSLYRIIVAEAERDPEVRRRYEWAQQAITSWIGELTRLGQRAGVVRPERDPEVATFLLDHLIESVLTELAARKSDRFRKRALDELTDMIGSYMMVGDPRR